LTAVLQVVTVTSDLAGAGTDARAFLTLFGQDGSQSGRLALDKPGVNLFERSQRDVFEVGGGGRPLSVIKV
jgi:hypothetical protein